MYWNKSAPSVSNAIASWIVTLDVLKCDLESGDDIKYKLNSNIRCIEIWRGYIRKPSINSWIVTLDVLKSANMNLLTANLEGWIVTLDVLKSFCCNSKHKVCHVE